MVNPVYQQDEELLLNPFGSKYLASGAYTDVNSNEFVVQEDTVISVLTGGDVSISENSIDYKASMNLSGVTLKRGALIVAPVGEAFKSITIDSGSIMAYNCVVGGTKPSDSVPLLLDLYPDAAAAYSLRKLRTDYEGPAIQVRINTVTTPQPTYNIGFDSDGNLDTADLLSKAAGDDAYVDTWYDQSGGAGNDAVQASASFQPQIVSSGSVLTLNNKPAVYSDGTKVLQTTSTNISVADANGNRSAFGTLNIANDSSLLVSYIDGGANLLYPIGYFNAVMAINVGGGFSDSVNYTLNNDSIFTSIVSNTEVEIWNNSVSDGATARGTITLGTTQISLFARRTNANNLQGFSNEIILYPSDQSANRVEIETNINNYYNVY